MPSIPDRPDPLLEKRTRLLLYVSDGGILFAACVFALTRRQWSWGPCLVAVAIVASAATCASFMNRVALNMVKPTDEQRLGALAFLRRRNVAVIYPAFATFAVALCVIAGAFASYWPDVLFGLIMLVSVSLPLAMFPALRRRAAEAKTPH